MKINLLNDAALVVAAAGSASASAPSRADRHAASGTSAAAAADAAAVSDTVTVSAAARSLGVASTSAGSGIDHAKVAAVKASIAAGTFRVDSGAIADKLLSNAQEVLSRTRSRDA
ncbi:MAG: flagellar biosynthesis anti-sigma factor FlgM [Janthinobacterium lividum]